MGLEAVILIADVLITTICTLAAIRLRRIKADITQLLLIIFVVTTLSLIPGIGFLLSMVVFAYLLVSYTEATMPEAVWIVAIAKMLTLAIAIVLGLESDSEAWVRLVG